MRHRKRSKKGTEWEADRTALIGGRPIAEMREMRANNKKPMVETTISHSERA
jgi:hypothetical protein